jgi:two-component system sensor histidine kinase DctS
MVADPAAAPGRRPPRRLLLWAALVLLLGIAQSLLVLLTVDYESSHLQDEADTVAAEAAALLRSDLLRTVQSLQSLLWNDPSPAAWRLDAAEMLRARRDLLRVERRDESMAVVDAVSSPYGEPLFGAIAREQMSSDAQAACAAARRVAAPQFSRSFFVPQRGGLGQEVIDVCVPLPDDAGGYMVATLSLAAALEHALRPGDVPRHEISLIEGDGTRLAREGAVRGAGVYRADRVVDLPGTAMLLRADSSSGRPGLIPNLTLALVLGLSLALFGVVLLLARDVRRRAAAEAALAEALAFRKAMEDSLSTGLRARDLEGRITYVNPAFCRMVGYGADELMAAPTPPYWPPERAAEYGERQQSRLAGLRGADDAREGFETVFMRRDGERFPVMIYEAPLVDGSGAQSGWMSAVLDMSSQRRVEELSRQQQERLQASARLASVGEMASLLSHELNQPLAAINSYASGSLNLLRDAEALAPGGAADSAPGADVDVDVDVDVDGRPGAIAGSGDAELRALLRQALARIAEQAERAGSVIKSVHDFVRRREHAHESLRADRLIDAVLPLVRLHARKSGTRIDIDVERPPPVVRCDGTLIEQVLLNLTRNAIQAMEEATPPERRLLRLRVRRVHERWVRFSVVDNGPGIAPDVARRLFTPFFSTRREGMGLGLSLCRTVIEQHGGALDFDTPADGGGTEFRFTLPAERKRTGDARDAAPAAEPGPT